MTDRLVQCIKLGKELPGLARAPYRNDLGQRIFETVSKEAWQAWIAASIKFVNTYRVDLASPEGQKFMLKQCAVYFGFDQGELAQTAWTSKGEPVAPVPEEKAEANPENPEHKGG